MDTDYVYPNLAAFLSAATTARPKGAPVITAQLEDGAYRSFATEEEAASYFAVSRKRLRRWMLRDEIGVGRNGRTCLRVYLAGGRV